MAEGSPARDEKDTPDSGRWRIHRGGERVHLKGDDSTLAVQVQAQVEMDEDSLFKFLFLSTYFH